MVRIVEREGLTLVDPGTIPALDDLGTSRPIMFYVRGNADTLNATIPLAVTGARTATSYGENACREIVSGLAQHGVTLVSEGAYGIDAAAHRAALASGMPTIAALAGGVDRAYPAGHIRLLKQITEHGAVISEVPMKAVPTRWRFLARNRVVAALSRATIVYEAGWRSGSLNLTGNAVALGRKLGSLPGPITSAASAGCHRLIREHGATLVTCPADVLELLGTE